MRNVIRNQDPSFWCAEGAEHISLGQRPRERDHTYRRALKERNKEENDGR